MPTRAAGILLAVALLLVTASARAESIEKPSLSVGDTWTYRTNGSFQGFELKGQLSSVVAAKGLATVLGATLDVVRVVVNGSGTVSGQVTSPLGTGSVAGTWIVTGEDLLEAGQLKLVSRVVDLSVDGLFRDIVPISVRATNTTLYRVARDDWRFPLVVGTNGSVESAYTYTQDYIAFGNQSHSSGSGNLTVGYSLGSGTTLAAPAGTFAAYPIDETWPDGSVERAYFSPVVGNDVKTESYNVTGSLVATTVLLSYTYQALEPARFLGLTIVEWGILAAVVAGVTALGAVLWRRSRKKRVLPPSLREPQA